MPKARNTPPTGDKIEIRYDAEPGHKLDLGNGLVIDGGKSAHVTADQAKSLLAAAWASVSLVDSSTPTWPNSNEEIEELAEKLGVELPAVTHEGGHPEPRFADKIAALEAAGYTPESAAAEAAKAETGSSDNEGEE